MNHITRLSVSYRNRTVGTMSLSPGGKTCLFEYDREWLSSGGFSISPLELPLKQGIFEAKTRPFHGSFGIFEDSQPDGYGRYLLHKVLRDKGIDDKSLSALDRLSIVGSRGMGALCYAPETRIITADDYTDDLDGLQDAALKVLSERDDNDASLLLYNSGNSGGARPKAIFHDDDGHWLVKFRHIYDPLDIGIQEARFNSAAREAGIDVPDFRLINGRYFASRRFDISPSGHRIHTATAGALLGVSTAQPILDYSNLLALTGFLTQDNQAVEEMFRRMVFNYAIGNKDDHSKNFSFYVEDNPMVPDSPRWRLAPAYDLTTCEAGYNGQHATSVNGTGEPTTEDFVAVGIGIRLSETRCREIIDKITEICSRI